MFPSTVLSAIRLAAWHRAGVQLLLLFWSVLAAASVMVAAGDPARVRRVTEGLLPGITIKGSGGRRMRLADRMQHYNVPGVSIAVFDKGELQWAIGAGVAEAGSDKPVTPETLFQAASISKPVAAAGAMVLVERGKLSLDEDVNLKLKSWKIVGNDFVKSEKITLRRLLSHTAGLNVHGFRGYASGESAPTLVQLLDGASPSNSKRVEPDLTPGSRWRYSGGGYSVMQQLEIDVGGKPFPGLMKELVLDAVGMKDSTYTQPLPAGLESRAATGHRGNGKPIPGKWHIYPEMAAAGLWTTPTDLVQFALALQKAWEGQSGGLLSAETVRLMLSPAPNSPNYGLGFSLRETEYGHGGSNEGFKCILVAYKEGRGAAIMTNGDRGSELASEILNAISAEYNWPGYKSREREVAKVDPAILQSYAGEYQFPQFIARVAFENGRLWVAPDGMGKWEIYPETQDRFFAITGGVPAIRFVKDSSGKIVEMSAGNSSARKIR